MSAQGQVHRPTETGHRVEQSRGWHWAEMTLPQRRSRRGTLVDVDQSGYYQPPGLAVIDGDGVTRLVFDGDGVKFALPAVALISAPLDETTHQRPPEKLVPCPDVTPGALSPAKA